MDEREFLKKIRTIQESDNKISLTDFPVNKLDGTVNAAQLISEESEPLKLLREDVQTLEAQEQKEEENKFKDIVSKLVKFEPIKVYPENVEWSGHLIREKVDWTFSLDDTTGCYIYTTELIQLRDETLEVLKKLRGYYDVWADEWSSRLTGLPTEESGEEVLDDTTDTGLEGDSDLGSEEMSF
jgi:hypothetical protein